ncbi:DUF3466 family protein [Aliiglaciecola litoralis]|uniref:DUF3466 family protein n=1 Tax=Aliiglaciecola litoralis TaxID=582857 RepID=A0ABN1LC32_9ALTE
MKISRLALGLTLSMLTLTSAHAAKYRVIELPLRDKGVNSFATAINERGDVVASIESPFNPPIDIDIIDFESETLIRSLTDVNGASVGNINDADLLTLYNFITASTRGSNIVRNNFFRQSNESTNPFLQQIANVQSYVLVNNEAEAITGFDQVSQDLGGLTKSADTLVKGINAFSMTVGLAEAPYRKINYRNNSGDNLKYHVSDFVVRGFLDINGTTFDVMPTETIGGGISVANDINNSFEVAGYGSIEINPSFEALLEQCDDEQERGDIPEEVCVRSLRDQYLAAINNNLNSPRGVIRPIDTSYLRRAMIWEFNAQGELLDSVELGTLIDPVPGDNRYFSSRATAINNNGIAVGASDKYFQDNSSSIIEMAAIFDGEETIGFIDDQNYFQSAALDINDNDIVVGFATKVINQSRRNKFFVHDYRGEVTIFPDDFFNSSSSVARGINNNNLVVGEGEVDTDLIGSRRSEAFIYDIDNDEFTNINSLLSCDSPYTIVQAMAINDENEIAANAIVYRERSAINGELALDAQGNTIFGNVSVAVKLVPIPGGTVDDCDKNTLVLDRKGASSWYLLGLLLLPLIRVFYKK